MKGRLPTWFKQKMASPQAMNSMRGLLDGLNLHTVCQSAHCPNIGNCFSSGTATFLILGDVCTRRCTFCAVDKGIPSPVDEQEQEHLAEAVRELNLNYVVVTSVTRDDLPDGGASQFARIIELLRHDRSDVTVEILIPDFRGSEEAIRTVVEARPHVINHNVETVPRLYPEVRPGADYERSLELLYRVRKLDPQMVTKSGLMLGLGEGREEVLEVMNDLREAECDLLTMGQYLQPSPWHHPVVRFVAPEEFTDYITMGRDMGFTGVASAPLVRSSFQAAELYAGAKKAGERPYVFEGHQERRRA
jgi:lipoic acid synthetase